jgi:hypothetical protein
MLTSASQKQHGTRDSAAAALLVLGMSAQYGPCRDRAWSPAPCACAASSRGTLCLICLESRYASNAFCIDHCLTASGSASKSGAAGVTGPISIRGDLGWSAGTLGAAAGASGVRHGTELAEAALRCETPGQDGERDL